MSMTEWAEREVEIACKRENPNREEGGFDYGCACYESALKAFKSLMEDGHSVVFSIGLTKDILNRLIDGKPLTPIEDTDDIWKLAWSDDVRNCKVYQCKRMSALFKDVYADGPIKYSDNNRYMGIDIDNPHGAHHTGLLRDIVEELYPITMPYMPLNKPYGVYAKYLLTDPKNGDFDTVGIFLYHRTRWN